MATTLQDIADATRTSVSTVSRVLAGGEMARRISAATRQRVTEAAQRLGYRPNLVARSLRTRRTHTVGLLVSDIANPWFGQLASLIEQSLHRHGYSLILGNSGEDPEVEKTYLRLMPQRGIDGLIVVPLARSRRALMELLPAQLPLVVLDRAVPGITSSVTTDQEQLAGQLCDTLEQVGVKRIALVSGPRHVVTHRRRAEVSAERFKVVSRVEGPAQKQTGYQAFMQFRSKEVDAIVCTNNFLGQGVLEAMGEVKSSPIIGCFDEIPMMHLLPVPIVCSNQDVPMLAEACVAQLLPQLQGQAPAKPAPTILPAHVLTNSAFNALLEEQESAPQPR